MTADSDKVSKIIVMWKDKCLFLKKNDNTWELPGGHLNVGEKFKAAAVRETKEETGIKIHKLKVLLKQNDFRLYKTQPKVIKVSLSEEHVDYKWVTRADIGRLTLSDATKLNIKIILKSV